MRKGLGNKVTRESLLQMAVIKKDYLDTCKLLHELEHKEFLTENEMELFQNTLRHKQEVSEWIPEINRFINEVINKDRQYYEKLSSYNFDRTILNYCIA